MWRVAEKCLVEFLMPDQFAGHHFDQVPVLFNEIARPRLQAVGNPNRAAPTVWWLAKG